LTGRFIISLDFELLWGVRDHADRDCYGANVLGARAAVPRILDIFAEHDIAATWATVGFLFCENKDELLDILPEDRPVYSNKNLSNYRYLDEVGENERSDPYYFAPSLIDRIRKMPKQEIGTHTLSHYYCLEAGPKISSFEADLQAACVLAARRGIEFKSIVFPRNQYTSEHLAVCARQGIMVYRGNEKSWAYHATPSGGQTLPRRAMRLLDAYTGLLGPHFSSGGVDIPTDIPASRFLRPRSGKFAQFHGHHVSVIRREMQAAARRGETYHLWWHPHNFGRNLEENLAALRRLAYHYTILKEEFGMVSCTMEACT